MNAKEMRQQEAEQIAQAIVIRWYQSQSKKPLFTEGHTYTLVNVIAGLIVDARNDALEQAAQKCENLYDGIRFAREIRALKEG